MNEKYSSPVLQSLADWAYPIELFQTKPSNLASFSNNVISTSNAPYSASKSLGVVCDINDLQSLKASAGVAKLETLWKVSYIYA